jgi:excisionase family DNA binding protein
MKGKFKNVNEAAEAIGVKGVTMRRMIHRGEISYSKIGSNFLFTDEDINEFLEKAKVKASPAVNASQVPNLQLQKIREAIYSTGVDGGLTKKMVDSLIQEAYRLGVEEGKSPMFRKSEGQEITPEMLATLPEREQKILAMRLGLNGDRAYTLNEVGLYFDLTTERIRQIEAKALRRLRVRRQLEVTN